MLKFCASNPSNVCECSSCDSFDCLTGDGRFCSSHRGNHRFSFSRIRKRDFWFKVKR